MPRMSSTSHYSGNSITLNRQIFNRFLSLWQEMNTLLINAVTQNPNISTRGSTTTRRYRTRAGRTVGKVTTLRKAA